MFNTTNPEAVMSGPIPVLKEVGPYGYEIMRTKENVKFDGKNRVSYDKRYIFIRKKLSREDDLIWTPNAVLFLQIPSNDVSSERSNMTQRAFTTYTNDVYGLIIKRSVKKHSFFLEDSNTGMTF